MIKFLPVLALIPFISISNSVVTVTGTDTNHGYSLVSSTNVLGGYSNVVEQWVGGTNRLIGISQTNPAEFFRGREDGMMVYSTNRVVEVGINNCGTYRGYFDFGLFTVDTNSSACSITDFVRSDTCITAAGTSSFHFGGPPLEFVPTAPAYSIRVYFHNSPPAGYGVLLSGFR